MSAKARISKQKIERWDLSIIAFFKGTYMPLARIALFVVFFWFGLIKLTGMSPAGELAQALTAKTIGTEYFDVMFMIISILECVIGILFLIPRAARLVIPLLFIHMLVVCAPLLLVPEMTWQAFLVPTLEGQYIIKNIIVVALAFAVAASTRPIVHK